MGGDFHYVPVVDMVPGTTGYWEIVLDDVLVNGKSISSAKRGVVDSGTSLMVVPTNEIKAVAAAVGAKQLSILPPLNREYSIDCDASAPDIDFQIDGKTYALTRAVGSASSLSWDRTSQHQSALSSSWATSSCVLTTASSMLANRGLASLRL